MLSRHNIRIKVLQALYSFAQSENPDPVQAEKQYLLSVDESFRLFMLNFRYLIKIAEYSKEDFEIRHNKYVPSDEDKQVTLKLYNNPILEKLRNNDAFQKEMKKAKVDEQLDEDLIRKMYQIFRTSEYHQSYQELSKTTNKEHQYCLVNLFKMMMSEEFFIDHLEDLSPTSEDDQSLIFGAIKRSIRTILEDEAFFENQLPNKEFVFDFGKELLYQSIKKDDMLQELIVDKLKNWNEDRVALLDMLLLKLGICEFMYFPSIPIKVTINEYVSLAKDYSTDKSKRFVNGILDRLMKELSEQGKINKEGRGLLEN